MAEQQHLEEEQERKRTGEGSTLPESSASPSTSELKRRRRPRPVPPQIAFRRVGTPHLRRNAWWDRWAVERVAVDEKQIEVDGEKKVAVRRDR